MAYHYQVFQLNLPIRILIANYNLLNLMIN